MQARPWAVAILVLSALLAGCAAYPRLSDIQTHTLAGNPYIPHEILRGFYSPHDWPEIRDMPYDAFVVLRGTVERDNSVTIRSTAAYYPETDTSRLQRAIRYADDVKLSPISVGTHIRPYAEVFVVFYESQAEPNMALVFARQTVTPGTQDASSRRIYLKTWTYE